MAPLQPGPGGLERLLPKSSTRRVKRPGWGDKRSEWWSGGRFSGPPDLPSPRPARPAPSSPGSLSSSSQPLFIFPRGSPSAPCPGPPDTPSPPPGAPAAPGPLAPHTDNGPLASLARASGIRHHGATATAPPLGLSSAGWTPDARALAREAGRGEGAGGGRCWARVAREEGAGRARCRAQCRERKRRGGRAAVSAPAPPTVGLAQIPAAAFSLGPSARDPSLPCALAPFTGAVAARGGRPEGSHHGL